MTPEKRIDKAVSLAIQFGGFDGDHHKMWVIDQMMRILLGTKAYKSRIKELNSDEDYDDWDVGIPP